MDIIGLHLQGQSEARLGWHEGTEGVVIATWALLASKVWGRERILGLKEHINGTKGNVWKKIKL